jgi:hypothetical protein
VTSLVHGYPDWILRGSASSMLPTFLHAATTLVFPFPKVTSGNDGFLSAIASTRPHRLAALIVVYVTPQNGLMTNLLPSYVNDSPAH